MFGGGGGSTNNYTTEFRNEEAARQERVRSGTKRIEDIFDTQFTDDFFQGRSDSYLGFAQPQLADQHKDAVKQLTFALDRRGSLDSSSRSSLEADLERGRAIADTEIKDRARAYATDARANVEGARGDLLNTLNATGDADAAVNSATARAKVLTEPVAYSPIAQAFSDFTTGIGQQAAAEKAFAYGATPNPPKTGTWLFGPRQSSISVKR